MNRTTILFIPTLLLLLCSCGITITTDDSVSIIPKPVSVEKTGDVFLFKNSIKINYLFEQQQLEFVTQMANEITDPIFGREIKAKHSTRCKSGAINVIQDLSMAAEEYMLSITPKRIDITTKDAQGAFFALQTIRQLIPIEAFGADGITAFEIPTLLIRDSSSFQYRGLMYDVGRYFFPVEDIKRAIDMVAMHKMNIFHWHLTEDQGWRIEIKKYPKLTEVGSIRKGTMIDPNDYVNHDSIPHGGFYTQEEIREVVEYARRRFITVIPEIEFPGHVVASIASYPHLSCTGEPCEVRPFWHVDDRVYCMGKESTFDFFADVLDEVLELFPSKYIHIGGDECPTVMWSKCPACQSKMKELSLTSERQLQGYGTKRIEDYLNSKGRSLVGWDEILEAGVSPNATIMSWRGSAGGIKAAKQGNYAIMSPSDHCYFDYYQSENKDSEPEAMGGFIDVEKVYELDPYKELSLSEQKYILGVQANLWTEYISTRSHADYMLLPRLGALAEVGWSYDRKNYEDFKPRILKMLELYDVYGYNYAKHILEVN